MQRIAMTDTAEFPPTPIAEPAHFTDAEAAVAHLSTLYTASVTHLTNAFRRFIKGERPDSRVRATYPYIAVTIPNHPAVDPRSPTASWDSPAATRQRSPGPISSATICCSSSA